MPGHVIVLPRKMFVLLSLLFGFVMPQAAAAEARLGDGYGQLPLHFEANRGQTHQDVRFLARGPGYSLYLTAGEAVLALAKPNPLVVRMLVVGADPKPVVNGLEELPGKANYFIGNDPSKWRTNVPTYAKVHYRSIYPGIDLIYYGNPRQLEYDFVVAPGMDPERIVLAFQGMDKLEIDAGGDLVLHVGGATLRQPKPLVYQEIDGVRREVNGDYRLRGENRVGFQVAAYDRSLPLVIDPTLVYSTYLGGSATDQGSGGMAVDSAGHAYVTGLTQSANFPTTAGFDKTLNGTDAFVTKIGPTGSNLVYSTYLGGSGFEIGWGLAVDAGGNAYLSGNTDSVDFPTTPGAFDPTYNGSGDAFVTKLDASGSVLVYSTYLGGSNGEPGGHAIAVDVQGNAYIAGTTRSADFPTTPGAFQPALRGPEDATVTKLNATGSALLYSTYLGGNNQLAGAENAFAIAIDAAGQAYVTGRTPSTDFPTTPGAFQPVHGGGTHDAFVTKLNPTGTQLVYSTYLGGNDFDQGDGVVVDAAQNAHVAGETRSTTFPTTAGAFQMTFAGGVSDAFVTKLNSTGSAPLYSTYLGGNGRDRIGSGGGGGPIALDPSGHVHVAGLTDSINFPTQNAIQNVFAGVRDAFVTSINPTGTALRFSTYLGGAGDDFGAGIALFDATPGLNAYVAGATASMDFPTTSGAFQRSLAGNYDVFVAKINDIVPNPPQAVVLMIDEDSIDNGNRPNFFTREQVNDDVAEIGVRAQLRFFRDNFGRTITLYTGEVGDEGWFALKRVPESWTPAGGLAGYIGNPGANPEDPPPHGTGPGLGAPDANGDRESLLGDVPDITPLRAFGLKNLEGRDVCAVVYDAEVSVNYNPLTGSLKGANLGTVAFRVLSVTALGGASSSSLPQVQIMILDAREACRRVLVFLTDSQAPPPASPLQPFDVTP